MKSTIQPNDLFCVASAEDAERVIARLLSEGESVSGLSRAVKDLALKDLGSAEVSAEGLLRATRSEKRHYGRALVARAYVHCIAQRLDEAKECLDNAAQVSEDCGDDLLTAEVYLNRVQQLGMAGEFEKAAQSGYAALNAFEKLCDVTMSGHARINLGITLRLLGRFSESIEMFEHARVAFVDDLKRLGLIASNSAEVLLELDQFAQAEVRFVEAKQAFVEGDDEHAAGIVEGNLADLLARQGRIDDALRAFESARQTLSRVGSSPDAARLRAEEAEVLLTAGSAADAKDSFDLAINDLRRAKLRKELARALQGRSYARSRVGDVDGSTADAHESVCIYRSLGMDFEAACAELVCAISARTIPDRDTLQSLLDKMSERDSVRISILVELAEVAARAGDHERAQQLLDQTEAGDARAFPPVQPKMFLVRAISSLSCGNDIGALELLRESERASERIIHAIRIPTIRTTVSRAASESVMLRCSVLAGRGGCESYREAFHCLEKFRTRTVEGPTDLSKAEGPMGAELREHQHALHLLYDRLGRQSSDLKLLRNIQKREYRQSELIRRLETTGDGINRTRDDDEANERSVLRADQTFVSFFTSRGFIGAVVRRGDNIGGVQQLCALTDFQRMATKLALVREKALHGSGDEARWKRVSNDLYKMVMHPLSTMIGRPRVLVLSKAGPMQGLSFRGMFDGERYLHDRFEIREIATLSLAHRAAEFAPPQGPPLVVGIPDEDAPAIAAEVESIKSIYPTCRSLGPSEARREAISESCRDANLVHIASHGILSPDHPLSSRFALRDGWITARELAGMISPGSSVVLSACALGERSGESDHELPGFVEALLGRGAREVVCASWALHDGAASALLANVHRKRHETSCSLAAALRRCQREMADAGEHPARWAAMVSHGVIA